MARKVQTKKQKSLDGNYKLFPILFVLCIIPLIMRLYIYDSGLGQLAWFPQRNEEIDIFLYYKAIALIITAVIMVGVLCYAVYQEKKKRKNGIGVERLKKAVWILPLLLFALFAFLSTIFSQYRSYGFSGIYEQFESIWVILSYCIVTIYVFYFVRTKNDVDILRKGLFFLLIVLGVLGLTQIIGHDFWETNLGKSLYVPAAYAGLRNQLSFSFSGSGNHQVYLTFYNPNYVGVFASVVLPISVMLCVGHKEWKKKLAWGVTSVLVFLCALGCGSRAFLLSLAATILVGIILYARKRIKHIPVILAGGLIFIAVTGIYLNYANVNIVQYFKSALVPQKNAYVVEDFIIEDDYVTLKYNGKSISMLCEVGSDGEPYFKAWDENKTDIAFIMDEENKIHFADERFLDATVVVYDGYDDYTYIAEVQVAGHRYAFAKGSEGYTYMNYAYRADKIEKAEAAVFTDYDSFFGNRGYLWSRSIPLLKDNLILGTGADTFSLVFPQKDYIAKINAGYQDQIITKPHSMYLQFGIQYGVLGLICFLVFAVMYVIQTLRLCWRADFKDVYSCCALGVFLGILGYGIMGISNDSCVALAPLAWLILGLGFALNIIVKEDIKNEENSNNV